MTSSPLHRAGLLLLLRIFAVVLAAEAAIMLLLPLLGLDRGSPLVASLLDVTLLLSLAGPPAYLWGLRPYQARLQAEATSQTTLRGQELKQRANQERLRMLFTAAVDGIVVIDSHGIIQSVNRAMERIFGYSVMEMVGRNVSMLAAEPHAAAHDRYLADYMASGRKDSRLIGKTLELEGRRKGDVVFPLELAVSEVRIEDDVSFIAIIRDISTRRSAEAQLRKLSSAVENSPAIVVITNARGLIEYVNPRLMEVTGYAVEEVIGQTPSMFKSGLSDGEIYRQMWTEISSGRVWRGEFHNRRKDGSLYWVLASVAPIVDPGGKPTHFVAVQEEITGRKLAEEMMLQAKDQAEAASQAKSDFLSAMSHELRTPLNAILGFAQILLDGRKSPLNERQRSQVDSILSGGQHLLALINGILDLARVESGRLEVNPVQIDVPQLVTDCLAMVEQAAERRGISIDNGVSADTPAVYADHGHLKQILLNLLSNAVKYNRDNGTVSVSTLRTAPTEIRLSVSDTGPGIPAAKSEQLFQPFNRLGAERTAIEGTGIGLAYSRKLVEAMGGSIGWDSQEGQGATFWVTLPAGPCQPYPAPAEEIEPLHGT